MDILVYGIRTSLIIKKNIAGIVVTLLELSLIHIWKIHEKLQGTDIVYLDVFNRLLQDGRLNPELTLDDLHLNGKGYSILTEALKQASGL